MKRETCSPYLRLLLQGLIKSTNYNLAEKSTAWFNKSQGALSRASAASRFPGDSSPGGADVSGLSQFAAGRMEQRERWHIIFPSCQHPPPVKAELPPQIYFCISVPETRGRKDSQTSKAKTPLLKSETSTREQTNYFPSRKQVMEQQHHHSISSDAGREQPESEHCCCSWLSDMGCVTGRRSDCTKCRCWRGWYNNKMHFTCKNSSNTS